MHFPLNITHGIYTFRFDVELSGKDKSFERWRLTAGTKVVVLQSNRPMLMARGLKKKPLTWKVVEGEVKDEKALAKVCKAIEDHLAGPPPPPPPPSTFPDLPARMLLNQPNQRKKGEGGGPNLGDRTKK
ncbi:hypothetical protein SAMN05444008_102393 [Cnuella takakiae]|uniref:Uncharacterized protein n=1 Tax=Cnuella takakiae TaxID=1302690 RepID=A0A1M4VUS8_9BACT|nr:hypothetical protein [Cnuella takakiae]OLY92489.1 hypothetical protein BUE76_11770 [Cnuella takakiae]SHE72801.1 hypothetical protein SAMN05444008_102393 [Cnuella takakiae]